MDPMTVGLIALCAVLILIMLRVPIAVVLILVSFVGIWAIVLVLPSVEAEFNATRADASLAYTTTMIGFALGNLLIGRIVDRFATGDHDCLVGRIVTAEVVRGGPALPMRGADYGPRDAD